MERVFTVFNEFGDFIAAIEADNKNQLALAIDDLAGEYMDGGALQGDIDDRDWETLTSAMTNISVVFDVSGGVEFEVKGVQVRSYTHYQEQSK